MLQKIWAQVRSNAGHRIPNSLIKRERGLQNAKLSIISVTFRREDTEQSTFKKEKKCAKIRPADCVLYYLYFLYS